MMYLMHKSALDDITFLATPVFDRIPKQRGVSLPWPQQQWKVGGAITTRANPSKAAVLTGQ